MENQDVFKGTAFQIMIGSCEETDEHTGQNHNTIFIFFLFLRRKGNYLIIILMILIISSVNNHQVSCDKNTRICIIYFFALTLTTEVGDFRILNSVTQSSLIKPRVV